MFGWARRVLLPSHVAPEILLPSLVAGWSFGRGAIRQQNCNRHAAEQAVGPRKMRAAKVDLRALSRRTPNDARRTRQASAAKISYWENTCLSSFSSFMNSINSFEAKKRDFPF